MEQTIDLSQAVVVQLEGKIWSGETQLKEGEIEVKIPRELVKLGSKRLYPKERIAPFEKLRRRAQRACKDCGPSWLGGYLVPTARLGELLATLDGIKSEFEAEKKAFLNAYDEGLKELEASAGDWWDLIEKSTMKRAQVENRLSLQPVVFRPALSENDGVDKQAYLGSAIAMIPKRIMEDIAADAADFWTQSVVGKDSVSRRALGRLERLRQKIEGMAGLDRRLTKLADRVADIQKQLPATGNITDAAMIGKVESLLLLMADTQKVDVYLGSSQTVSEDSMEELSAQDGSEAEANEDQDGGESVEQELDLPPPSKKNTGMGSAHGLFT